MTTGKKRDAIPSVSSLIEAILKDKGLDRQLQKYRAWTIWDEVVGPQIARNARPLRIRDAVLEVRVEQAAWMQQLQLLKPKILKELNRHLGNDCIRDIFWKRGHIEPGPLPGPAPEKKARPPRSLPDAESARLESMLDGIEDEELQRTIRSLYTLDYQDRDPDAN